MRRSNWAVAGYLLLVFASGAGVGVFAHWMHTAGSVMAKKEEPRSRSEDYRQRYLNEMQTRLKLTPAQLTTLNAILDTTRARFQSVREKYGPEMKTIQEGQTQEIRGILTEAQKPEYEKIRQEREERMRSRKRHSGGGC